MKYHNNDVYIKVSSSSGYTLQCGSYKVQTHSVSPGQDPKGKIQDGVTKSFQSDGKMTFVVGRHGTSQVANWFKEKVPGSCTTFNHDPGKLNFAFMGKLQLTLKGGVLGSSADTFVFENIAIAQGHAGGRNNWWFGGPNCVYLGSDTVRCEGVSKKSGLKLYCRFWRGVGSGAGFSVNQILLTSLTGVPNWMSTLDDSVTLNRLVMPGSHDAGMSSLEHCNPPIVVEPYTKTQAYPIGRQLACGSRYFDIRVDYDHGQLVTYHRSGRWGCNGQNLKSVFDDVVGFLQQNSRETAILKISHIRDYGSDHKPAETKKKLNTFLSEYTDHIYSNADPNINLADISLRDVRGKMILVFDYSEYFDTSTGRFRYKDTDSATAQSGANITVYDHYSNTDDYEHMRNDQEQKWSKYAGLNSDYFFLLSWTLTPQFTCTPKGIAKAIAEGIMGIEMLAARANSHLAKVLNEKIVNEKWQKPNIVYIDFLDTRITQDIISYNFDGSLPLQKH